MSIHAVLFDLDGTLLDTIADIAAAMNKALSDFELPTHGVEAYRGMVGWGLARLAESAVPADFGEYGKIEDVQTALLEAYKAQPVVHTRPYDGIPELLESLQRSGNKLAVLSNKSHELVVEIVNATMKPTLFAEVRGAGPETPHKPDPSGARAVLKSLGVSAQECLFVGDSALDIKTAIAVGAVPVGVSWGLRPTAELIDAGAAYIVDRPSEIKEIIDKQ